MGRLCVRGWRVLRRADWRESIFGGRGVGEVVVRGREVVVSWVGV